MSVQPKEVNDQVMRNLTLTDKNVTKKLLLNSQKRKENYIYLSSLLSFFPLASNYAKQIDN